MVIIQKNEEKHGIELLFDAKPDQDTRDAMKAAGFRWHRTRGVWYAKDTPENAEFAESLTTGTVADRLGGDVSEGYMGAQKWEGKRCGALYGADLAKAIRRELKIQGLHGITVRAGRATYTDTITLTVKTTAADYLTLDEYKKVYDINDLLEGSFNWIKDLDGTNIRSDEFFNRDADGQAALMAYNAEYDYKRETGDLQLNYYYIDKYKIFTDAMRAKLHKAHEVLLSFNYDDSNGMVDYYDTNFYYSIDIKRVDQ